MFAEKYMRLFLQECPKEFKYLLEDTNPDRKLVDAFVHHMCIKYITDHELNLSLVPVYANNCERRNTIAYCEESYEQGYSAIINDGKLLGFRREKV